MTRVYGHEPASAPFKPASELPPVPYRRTQRALERELAAWNLWMEAGQSAMARHEQCRPHSLISLTQLARLLKIAFEFPALAIGLPTDTEETFANRFESFMADLQRAYGQRRP